MTHAVFCVPPISTRPHLYRQVGPDLTEQRTRHGTRTRLDRGRERGIIAELLGLVTGVENMRVFESVLALAGGLFACQTASAFVAPAASIRQERLRQKSSNLDTSHVFSKFCCSRIVAIIVASYAVCCRLALSSAAASLNGCSL